jgi:hypothetical protein
MPIYTFKSKQLTEVKSTQFGAEGIQERHDLQAALRDKITVIENFGSETPSFYDGFTVKY